jgi:nucleoside-diphosphate-sugar epimerase
LKVLVTGAAGFIGAALVEALAARADVDRVVAFDQAEPGSKHPAKHPKVEAVSGNLAYAPMARSLVGKDVDAVFHLASLVSGGAEQNFELGMKVNFDATRDLLEAARLAGRNPRFVFTSSIAVYRGVKLEVTDDTRPTPRLSYGAQKLMCEVMIDDYTRRGYADGRSVRLPTVLVRPGAANTAMSGWSSAIIREPLAGRDYTCPVAPHTQMACISVNRVVESLLRALDLPGAAIGPDRTLLLTGIPVSAQAMLDAVHAVAQKAGAGRKLGRVRFEPDPAAQAVMDTVARSTTSARGAALGLRPSASIEEIVTEYLQAHPA